jgi:hypothetical protein
MTGFRGTWVGTHVVVVGDAATSGSGLAPLRGGSYFHE